MRPSRWLQGTPAGRPSSPEGWLSPPALQDRGPCLRRRRSRPRRDPFPASPSPRRSPDKTGSPSPPLPRLRHPPRRRSSGAPHTVYATRIPASAPHIPLWYPDRTAAPLPSAQGRWRLSNCACSARPPGQIWYLLSDRHPRRLPALP